MEKNRKAKAICKKCKGKGIYKNGKKSVFCLPCSEKILKKSQQESAVYYVDVVISCHAISKRYLNGKNITDNIQYLFAEKISDIQSFLDKRRIRVNFYIKPSQS